MSYLFTALLLANALLLGYWVVRPNNPIDTGLAHAKSQLVAPVPVVNNASKIPPKIGEK